MTGPEQQLLPIGFDVVECSSEDKSFECSALQTYQEDGDGWLSEKNCQFPQVVVLKVHGEKDEICIIDRLEILSHEFSIAQTIEISIGHGGINGQMPSTFDECATIQNLGFVTMDSNERSNFQDRELKSVPIGHLPTQFIKLTLKQCYENEYNIHQQVGIVGLRVFQATKVAEKSVDATKSQGTKRQAMNIALPSPNPKSLPSHIRYELDPRIQQSVERLEKLKKERAALEDFDMALKIKEAMTSVYAFLIAYKECENKMRDAAMQEDYAAASRLKTDRDMAKEAALQSLHEVEQEFIGSVDDIDRDVSLSTIKDESFMSQKSAHFSQPFPGNDQISIASNTMSPFKRKDSKQNASKDSQDESSDNSTCQSEVEQGDDYSGRHSHPLAGTYIDHADLPTPEEISKEISTDLAHKVEELFGNYRAKCLFSKHWQLRDAVLAKMSQMCVEISTEDCAEMASILSLIIERCIDDNNVQVYQSALILVDVMLLQCERNELPQTKVTLLLSKICTDVLSKLADSSKKVVESAELSLLAMAHSPCVGVVYICNAASKKLRSAEAKGGRAIKARLHFIEHLTAEFGKEVPLKRIIDFAISSKAFDHKDVAVRDAVKAVILSLMMVGSVLCLLLESCAFS